MDQLDYSAIHVKHIVYPLLDCRQDNLSSFFEHFFNTIERQIKLGSVLIHCYSGVSRVILLIIIVFCVVGWLFNEEIRLELSEIILIYKKISTSGLVETGL